MSIGCTLTAARALCRSRKMYKRVSKKLVEDEDENGELQTSCVLLCSSRACRCVAGTFEVAEDWSGSDKDSDDEFDSDGESGEEAGEGDAEGDEAEAAEPAESTADGEGVEGDEGDAASEDEEETKGPRYCEVCPDKVLLNDDDVKLHLESKVGVKECSLWLSHFVFCRRATRATRRSRSSRR